jgi:type II secretory pathway predicted ATPase ExeA
LYEGFYRLQDHPFRLTADPAYICLTAQHREALAGLVYSIRTRLGLVVLIGEAGTGKTTLLRTLTDLFDGRSFVLARCNNPTLSREEFYDLLLAELGVECASSLKSRQLRALQEALMRFRDAGRSAVLIVDEAQRLPLELLEEIRLLLNLETPREKLLQIVMAGQPELGDTLARPELRQLKQRVSAFCRLEPLSADDVREYLQHRLSKAGLPGQKLFPEEIVGLIYSYTQGIPRLVNSLCDAALQTGFALQSPVITASIVQEAAGDLELPDGGEGLAKTESSGSDHSKVITMPAVSPESKLIQSHPQTELKGDGGNADERMPLEGYASRQKSLGFFGHLLDRWK